MKPTHVIVDYFANEILKRTSKSFAKSELSKDEFDSVVKHLDAIKYIVNNANEKKNRSVNNEINIDEEGRKEN